MTQGPDPNTGLVGPLESRVVRAPKAWHNLLRVEFEAVPTQIRRSAAARHAMRGLFQRPKRGGR